MKIDISAIRQAISSSDYTPSKSDDPLLNRPRKRPSHLRGEGRVGAVMLLLYPKCHRQQLSFVLTRRRDDLRDHPGQISLPGGSCENNESLQQTAIRESQEEIGIHPESIEIIGSLESVYIPPSDFTVHPFVGWHHESPNFRIQASEVAALIEADVKWLLAPDSLEFGPIKGQNMPDRAAYFQIGENQVWGATARVLIDFRNRLLAEAQKPGS